MIAELLCSVVLFILTCVPALAQYPVSEIPDSLKSNAVAVIRDNTMNFTFVNLKKNVYSVHAVITVLKKSGDKVAAFTEFYDHFRKITFRKGMIYNENGNLIRKVKSSELNDYSGSGGASLFVDYRLKQFTPLVSSYPYTVEYEFEVTIDGSFSFPDWLPQVDYGIAVQSSSLQVNVPAGYNLRYKAFNMHDPCHETEQNGMKSCSWKVQNLKALEREPFSPELRFISPHVLTAPSGFEMEDYPGNMTSWKDFGQWLNELNKGRDILPAATISKLEEMVKNIPDEKDKIRILYKYLQSKTRYVSVQLGIGGLQPIPASVVDQVGYGDCKALSNYMLAMLKAVGIKSYYTTVKAGDYFPQMIDDFPSFQANHAILFVPLKKDTVWLECTSQICPFNYLGMFTSDRMTLVMKDDGGELVRTRVYPARENFLYTKAKVRMFAEGNASATITRSYGGLQFDEMMYLEHAPDNDVKDWLYKNIDIPNYQLKSYSIAGDSTDRPEASLNLSLELVNYASASGKRLFVPCNLLSKSDYFPAKTRERKQPIEVSYGFYDADTVEYELPPGFSPEFSPAPVTLNTPFGDYRASISIMPGKLIYCRSLLFRKGTYPASQYPDFQKFFKDIANADANKIILIAK